MADGVAGMAEKSRCHVHCYGTLAGGNKRTITLSDIKTFRPHE